MDPLERRELLKCESNPNPAKDYISEYTGQLKSQTKPANTVVRILFIPDRLILDPESLNLYLSEMSSQPWPSIEELANTLLRDIQNEVVPRWVQVHVDVAWPNATHLSHQMALVEDQQPGWSNQSLFQLHLDK